MSEENSPTEPFEEPKKSFPWISCLVVLVVIAALAGLTQPMVIRSKYKGEQTEATSNLRQIGLALFEFETEYGSFPDEKTAVNVTENNPTHGQDLAGDSSNALFRQLFAANITQSEAMFYAKVTGTNKPDGDISAGHALERGEVAYGCVSGISTAGYPARIVAFTPIIPGTTKFDPKPFDGFAVGLRIDNSVSSFEIQEDGSIRDKDGDILSPTHPIWGGKAFKIHYPDLDPPPKVGFFESIFR